MEKNNIFENNNKTIKKKLNSMKNLNDASNLTKSNLKNKINNFFAKKINLKINTIQSNNNNNNNYLITHYKFNNFYLKKNHINNNNNNNFNIRIHHFNNLSFSNKKFKFNNNNSNSNSNLNSNSSKSNLSLSFLSKKNIKKFKPLYFSKNKTNKSSKKRRIDYFNKNSNINIHSLNENNISNNNNKKNFFEDSNQSLKCTTANTLKNIYKNNTNNNNNNLTNNNLNNNNLNNNNLNNNNLNNINNLNNNNNLNNSEELINLTDLININKKEINICDLYLNFPNFNNLTYTKNTNKNSYISYYVQNNYKIPSKKENYQNIICNINIKKPKYFIGNWPKSVSFFGLFDGHCGKNCSDYLKKNLLSFIINNNNFPKNPLKSIENGFLKAEKDFFTEFKNDFSGCCVLICLIINENIFIGNCGNSKLLIYKKNTKKFEILTNEHSLNNKKEKERIEKNGGKIFQEKILINKYINEIKTVFDEEFNINNLNKKIYLLGPKRFKPGNLLITRSIGDFHIKNENNKLIIPNPHLNSYKINKNSDFILILNDAICNYVKKEEIEKIVDLFKENGVEKKFICDFLLKMALKNNCIDNICCVLINIKFNKTFLNLPNKFSNKFLIENHKISNKEFNFNYDNYIETEFVDYNNENNINLNNFNYIKKVTFSLQQTPKKIFSIKHLRYKSLTQLNNINDLNIKNKSKNKNLNKK